MNFVAILIIRTQAFVLVSFDKLNRNVASGENWILYRGSKLILWSDRSMSKTNRLWHTARQPFERVHIVFDSSANSGSIASRCKRKNRLLKPVVQSWKATLLDSSVKGLPLYLLLSFYQTILASHLKSFGRTGDLITLSHRDKV